MPLDPASRVARVMLAEKGLPAQLVESPPSEDNAALLAANPAGEIPVLIDEPAVGREIAVCPAITIAEYLEDAYPTPALFPQTARDRAEARRLCAWFCDKFEREVIPTVVLARIQKRLTRRGAPDVEAQRASYEALSWHMDYFNWLLEKRTWFAGEKLSVADLVAAGYLSAVDYVDAAPWTKFPAVKDWYARMKSRPALRPILRDRVDGMAPPPHYDDPDF